MLDLSDATCVQNTTLGQNENHVISAVEIAIGLVIVIENVIVFSAIMKNWKALVRQQNLYRYVISLVAADLLNGITLFLYSAFQIYTQEQDIQLVNENSSEVFRNLLTGVVHGLTFASLASAALLNLVLRVTSTQALAKAAAIKSHSKAGLKGTSWIRSPRTTIALIGIIWMISLVFVVLPLAKHCEDGIVQCTNDTTKEYFVIRNNSFTTDPGDLHCSILRKPATTTYMMSFSVLITVVWIVMIMCNLFTTCIKTEVKKGSNVEGKNTLKLTHKFGITKDLPSFFAFIITLNMTVSTLPYVIFTFVTEGGSPQDRVAYGINVKAFVVDIVELTIYISSIVNPLIYTAMLSRLRSDVSRLLQWNKTEKQRPVRGKCGVVLNSKENNSL